MKLISLLSPYLIALILTLIIEGILCWIFLRSKPWLKFTCLVNLFTNPLVNALYSMLYRNMAQYNLLQMAPWVLLALEIVVWLSEAWLFYSYGCNQEAEKAEHSNPLSSIYKALLFSFVLNAATYLTGLLLQL